MDWEKFRPLVPKPPAAPDKARPIVSPGPGFDPQPPAVAPITAITPSNTLDRTEFFAVTVPALTNQRLTFDAARSFVFLKIVGTEVFPGPRPAALPILLFVNDIQVSNFTHGVFAGFEYVLANPLESLEIRNALAFEIRLQFFVSPTQILRSIFPAITYSRKVAGNVPVPFSTPDQVSLWTRFNTGLGTAAAQVIYVPFLGVNVFITDLHLASIAPATSTRAEFYFAATPPPGGLLWHLLTKSASSPDYKGFEIPLQAVPGDTFQADVYQAGVASPWWIVSRGYFG